MLKTSYRSHLNSVLFFPFFTVLGKATSRKRPWTAILTLLLVVSSTAHAGQDLVVRQSIKVYAERKESSTVLRQLDRGDRVPVSPTNYGAWRKLHLRVGGDWKDGWVKAEDVAKNAMIMEREGDPNGPKRPVLHQVYAIGGMLTAAYVTQGGSNVSTTEGVPVNKGTSSGMTTFFGLSGLIPLSKGLALNPELLFRQVNLTGNFSVGGSPQTAYQLTEGYVGLSMILRSYFVNDGDWWWGGGFEFSYGSTPVITYSGGQTLPLSGGGSTYNSFLIAEAAVGVDLNISGNFYAMPDFRIGYVPLLSGAALDGELHVAVVYAFQ